jgi:hypothetical protein
MSASDERPYEYREQHADDDGSLYIYLWVRQRAANESIEAPPVKLDIFKVLWRKATLALNMVALPTSPGNGKNTGDYVFRQLPAKTRRSAAHNWITHGEGLEWAKGMPAQLVEIMVNGRG